MKFRLLVKYLEPGSSVLEVGSGSGWFAERLLKKGYKVTTIDISDSTADIVGDIKSWKLVGIAEHSFDAIVALELIEHVDCLDDLTHICKIDGLIFLSSPHPKWDRLLYMLEKINLLQPRTSEHINLTDFKNIRLPAIARKRPMGVHQVGLFRNSPV